MTKLLIAWLLAMIAFPAQAQVPAAAAGRWAARSNGRPLMILTLEHDATGWHGGWRRPTTFSSDQTMRMMSDVRGPAVDRALIASEEHGDGLDLTFAGAPGKQPDHFHFAVRPDGIATLSSPDVPASALVLDRAVAGETVIAPAVDTSYPIDQHWSTNAEMTAIFTADQKAREDWMHADPGKVATDDAARREQTRKLLDAGALASAEDYWHAAFVFQHGMEPDDYLLAHALATVAVARGKADATWIAAATLDRYLQQIGQPQVYGTQYSYKKKVVAGKPQGESHATQEPYDRRLISDALREATGVPPIADQEQRRLEFEKQFKQAAAR